MHFTRGSKNGRNMCTSKYRCPCVYSNSSQDKAFELRRDLMHTRKTVPLPENLQCSWQFANLELGGDWWRFTRAWESNDQEVGTLRKSLKPEIRMNRPKPCQVLQQPFCFDTRRLDLIKYFSGQMWSFLAWSVRLSPEDECFLLGGCWRRLCGRTFSQSS